MKIGSISENRKFENRIAITPEILKKYKSLGLQVNLSKDYALHLGIKDSEYESVGAKIFKDDDNDDSDFSFIKDRKTKGKIF